MKKIENMTKGNALVAVKKSSENYEIVVTDKKHVGAVVAALMYGTVSFGMNEVAEEVTVVEAKSSIYKKISKITSDIENPVVFAQDAPEIKKLVEILANEEEHFDINELVENAELASARVYVVEKDAETSVVKSNPGANKEMETLLEGYTVLASAKVSDKNVLARLAATYRSNKERGLKKYPISIETRDYVIGLITPADVADETAAEADTTAAE